MGRDSGQRSLFDMAPMIQHKIEPGSIYHILHELGDEYLSDDDFAEVHHSTRGRYSLPPSLLAKIALLQYHYGVSDRETVRRMQFDLRWRMPWVSPWTMKDFLTPI